MQGCRIGEQLAIVVVGFSVGGDAGLQGVEQLCGVCGSPQLVDDAGQIQALAAGPSGIGAFVLEAVIEGLRDKAGCFLLLASFFQGFGLTEPPERPRQPALYLQRHYLQRVNTHPMRANLWAVPTAASTCSSAATRAST